MKQYLDLVENVFLHGRDRGDRTGTGTRSLFGTQSRYNLLEGFPIVTTKKVFLKGIILELLWFLRGETNIRSLNEAGVHIWDDWANKDGDLGPVYGKMWRSWPTYEKVSKDARSNIYIPGTPIDQIAELIKNLKEKPESRRHLITGWNPEFLPIEGRAHAENIADNRQALPPCHTMFQFYVEEMTLDEKLDFDKLIDEDLDDYPKYKLSCQLYQRSADLMLGVPFNIASYALLTMMIARVCGFGYGDFIHTIGDAHIYKNHFDGVKEQLKRIPHELPVMKINYTGQNIDEFKYSDFMLCNYQHDEPIKFEIAV